MHISSISCQHPDQGGGQWVWLSGVRGVVSGRGLGWGVYKGHHVSVTKLSIKNNA